MISSVGFKSLLWFIGQVEDVAQNSNLSGRVRVRAFGIHPPPNIQKDPVFAKNQVADVPTDALPWAPVVNSTGGGISKIPMRGEWVIGFFIDGRDAQHPIVMGTLPGMNTTLPSGSGTVFDNLHTARLQENIDNFNEMGGGKNENWSNKENSAVTSAILNTSDESLMTADDNEILEFDAESEGTPEYLSVVQSKPQGSNIQVGGDGTSEHISLFHETGSHIQIDKHGNVKSKSIETSQEIATNIQKCASGSYDIVVGKNLSIHVQGGKATIKIAGDIDIESQSDINFTASGKIKLNAGESCFIRAASLNLHSVTDDINIHSNFDLNILSNKNTSITSKDKIDMLSNNDMKISSLGGLNINSDNNMFLDAPEIRAFEDADKAQPTAPSLVSPKEMSTPPARAVISNSTKLGNIRGASNRSLPDNLPDSDNTNSTIKESTPLSTIPQVKNLDTTLGSTPADRQELYTFIRNEIGLSHEHAIGVLANIQRESAFKPGAIGDNGQSFGLFQFFTGPGSGTRGINFLNAVPDWQTNPKGQIRYMLTQDPSGSKFSSLSFSSSEEAAIYFTEKVERPQNATQFRNFNSVVTAELETSIRKI